jgi:hypothetical protein
MSGSSATEQIAYRLEIGALPQARDLREREPHPVAGVPVGVQLRDGRLVRPALVLGGEEAVVVEGTVCHGRRSSRLTVRLERR